MFRTVFLVACFVFSETVVSGEDSCLHLTGTYTATAIWHGETDTDGTVIPISYETAVSVALPGFDGDTTDERSPPELSENTLKLTQTDQEIRMRFRLKKPVVRERHYFTSRGDYRCLTKSEIQFGPYTSSSGGDGVIQKGTFFVVASLAPDGSLIVSNRGEFCSQQLIFFRSCGKFGGSATFERIRGSGFN